MNDVDKALAMKCGIITSGCDGIFIEILQEFADSIRADEKEANALVCDELGACGVNGASLFARAIRERVTT
jgi:hypothetical protein